MRVSEKLTASYIAKWIRDPQAFRPDTRMPQFYHQLNTKEEGGDSFGESPEGEFEHPHKLADLAYTEMRAITAYLLDKSKATLANPKTGKMPKIAAKGKPEDGKQVFATRCAGLHVHKDHRGSGTVSSRDANVRSQVSDVAAKFVEPGQKEWLISWDQNPAAYHPKSYMPNLQLTDQGIADAAAYLLSVPGKGSDAVVPALDSSALRDLVLSIQIKGKSQVDAKRDTDAMSPNQQLLFLGREDNRI